MKYLKTLLIAGTILGSMASANATIITQSDFGEDLSLPFLVGPDVREFEVLGAAIGAGAELTAADEIANPGSYSGHADMDLSASGLLTLTGREPAGFADYQLAVFTLSNIMFDDASTLLGVNVLGLGSEVFRDRNGTLFPTPDVSFTANSVTITYAVGDLQNAGDEFNFGEGLSSQFQLVFGDRVPVSEPGTLALFALTLVGLSLRRRQK